MYANNTSPLFIDPVSTYNLSKSRHFLIIIFIHFIFYSFEFVIDFVAITLNTTTTGTSEWRQTFLVYEKFQLCINYSSTNLFHIYQLSTSTSLLQSVGVRVPLPKTSKYVIS